MLLYSLEAFLIRTFSPALFRGEGTEGRRGYLVSMRRLIFTLGRLSNWLTVLVSLLRPLY
jgi:hypothetical protein